MLDLGAILGWAEQAGIGIVGMVALAIGYYCLRFLQSVWARPIRIDDESRAALQAALEQSNARNAELEAQHALDVAARARAEGRADSEEVERDGGG